MQVGDKAHVIPTFGDVRPEHIAEYTAEVIYIHPERRFYRVKFTFYPQGLKMPAGMSFTESFFQGNRRGNA